MPDSFNRVEKSKPTTISSIRTIRDIVIEPVTGDFIISIPTIKTIPDICPISKRRPFDIPSDAGKAISAPYWKPMGPALNRKKPIKNAERINSVKFVAKVTPARPRIVPASAVIIKGILFR